MKIFAALGPGDIVQAHREQMAGRRISSETALPYSEQLVGYCKARNIPLLGVAHHARRDQIDDGVIRLESDPDLVVNSQGASFHIDFIRRSFRLAARAKRFGASYAIVDSGVTHYFALAAFSALGIRTIVDFHNTLWPAGFPDRGMAKAIQLLNGAYFRFLGFAAIGVSEECGRQLVSIAGRNVKFDGYRAQFKEYDFADRPDRAKRTDIFRVIFAGRVEVAKGALDLIEIGRLVKPHGIVIDVCGEGPAMGPLRDAAEGELKSTLVLHGKLDRHQLQTVYRNASAAIVPTRSVFREGLPRTCIEAVFHGIPVVTSDLANARDALGPAILRAESNNPADYAKALLDLVRYDEVLETMRCECAPLRAQFLDRTNSLPAALDRILASSSLPSANKEFFDKIFAELV